MLVETVAVCEMVAEFVAVAVVVGAAAAVMVDPIEKTNSCSVAEVKAERKRLDRQYSVD